ncbi:hypothetical protein PIB30_111329, partial [Stylosanthes scabra]|nr:hypothetical protein [Stylosanthes scabra]
LSRSIIWAISLGHHRMAHTLTRIIQVGEITLTSVGVVIKGKGTTTTSRTTIALTNLFSSDNSNLFNNLLQFHPSRNHHLQHHPILLKPHSRNLLNPLQVLFKTPTAS